MAATYDATSNSGGGSAVSSISWSHTCTGSDRALFVGGGSRAGTPDNTTSVTYNGVSMVEKIDDIYSAIFTHISVHTLVAPATGSNTIVVTLGGTDDEIYYGAVSANLVDQTTPFGTLASAASDANNTPSVTVGSVGAGDLVVDTVVGAMDGASTAGADQTERWDISGGSAGSTQLGSAGGVMSWTTAFNGWYQAAIAFKAAVGSRLLRSSATLAAVHRASNF